MPPASFLEFAHKWSASKLTERAAAHDHFNDLCHLLGEPTPAEADPTGETYAFEKAVTKTGGGAGFADVWRRGHFAWEYKGKHHDLRAAYDQLLKYREGLDNPPLLVVCDFDRFEVHTNFTDTAKQVYSFDLSDLATAAGPTFGTPIPPLDVLHAVFKEPDRLRPRQTLAHVTERAAAEFARLSASLRSRGAEPGLAARFLVRLLFCLFAEDIGLLPDNLFTRLVDQTRQRPSEFALLVGQLFRTMATGGYFGVDHIDYFNGGLFADDQVLNFTVDDLKILLNACRLDWASVEPAIFGTLFERGFDPDKRAQLGAHYTSRADILLVVEPVVMAPLRRRWNAVQQQAQALLEKRNASRGAERNRHQRAAHQLLLGFADELATTRILDPAAGSGNFLYLALRRLMDLEKEAISFALVHGLQSWFPKVGPEQLHGIEINPYAHELAQAVVWIGYIQWLRDNGFGRPSEPILKPLVTIEQIDALLVYQDGQPVEPKWPEAEVIIGNPPFLGGKRLRTELGDKYVDDLFLVYEGRVPRESDLVAYWFERAASAIAAGSASRAGLLATQAIRRGANQRVLRRIKSSGDIFLAWSDRPWVLEGADVRVSIIGFDRGVEAARVLDGASVPAINADLSAGLDLTLTPRLRENLGISFMGSTKGGDFDLDPDEAERLLRAPVNPNGRPNTDVVVPWINGLDITRRPRGKWIIDFGVDTTEATAALYEEPFEYIRRYVYPDRQQNNRESYRRRWWIHVEPRPEMRHALAPLSRYIATSRVSRHRVFAWVPSGTLPDSRVYVFAREDDYFFGVLQSRVHVAWALAKASRHGVGNDPTYNNQDCFETFPFPWPPGHEPIRDARVDAIAGAALSLVAEREAWLNPAGAPEDVLKNRTLALLYNAKPTWLQLAHERLDRAVLDAYGWPVSLSDDELLERLFTLSRERADAEARAGGQLPLPEPAVVRGGRFLRRRRQLDEPSSNEAKASRGRGGRRPA